MNAISTLFQQVDKAKLDYTEGLITQAECIVCMYSAVAESVQTTREELSRQKEHIAEELNCLP